MNKIFERVLIITGIIMVILTACEKPEEPKVRDPLAYDNINQFIVKGQGWKQIVKDKAQFVLGEADSISYSNEPSWSGAAFTFAHYKHSYGTFPAMDGSTVCIPMAAEFVWQFTNLSDVIPNLYPGISETMSFLNFSTTSGAYNNLINGGTTNGVIVKINPSNSEIKEYHFNKRPDIVLATYPSTAELNMASNAGIEMIIRPVCYDSFVFITHRDNPVESLTVDQVQKIYSGQITNWKEVGGRNEKIVAYQREPNSGSQTAMEEWVMKGIKMTNPPMAQLAMGMGMLIEVVAGYENGTMSLGYTYKYYVDRLYTSPDIKILKVNGVMPSDENVRNSNYPFIAPYNAVIRSTDVDEVGGRFMNWILSDEGQACITQAGYVSIREL
ncbi:MAG: substrate-binding domain-containing protein [Tannerella sp.]|jgi:phosphate transport system substrate-binding protein|nr:substrate-binding domain-containing protein [Tannerella sp.]